MSKRTVLCDLRFLSASLSGTFLTSVCCRVSRSSRTTNQSYPKYIYKIHPSGYQNMCQRLQDVHFSADHRCYACYMARSADSEYPVCDSNSNHTGYCSFWYQLFSASLWCICRRPWQCSAYRTSPCILPDRCILEHHESSAGTIQQLHRQGETRSHF